MELKQLSKLDPPDLRWASETGARLLREYGLSDWNFAAHPLYKQPQTGDVIATCRPSRREIVVYIAQAESRYQIRQSILHEITHAIAGPKAAHGPRWQTKARDLGVSEYDISVSVVAARAKWWVVGCWPWQGVLARAKPFRNRPLNRRPVTR